MSRRAQAGVERLGWAMKARLVAEIVVTYGRARWLLWRRPLPEAVAALRRIDSSVRGDVDGFRLGRAVSRTLGWLPVDSRCLVTSLVLTNMLARRGVESVVVIGVDVDPVFSAHAWVESGGAPLLSPLDDGSRLVVL
jgi:Transglutaminase-like superfamily